MKKLCRYLGILLLLLVFLLWQNFSIQTEYRTIAMDALQAEGKELRIVQLSDLHGRQLGKEHKRLLKQVKSAHPDMICITGDLFGSREEYAMLPTLLQGLCALAPTYYVTGNHEWQVKGLGQILEQMESMGVRVLRNEYEVIPWEGSELILVGVDDPCGPYDQKSPQSLLKEIREKEGQDSTVILLAHRNDGLPLWAQEGVALVLSGHCHGGVVRLPFVGGLFGPMRTFLPDYDAGLYRQGETSMFVSRGLGYSRVKLRLFNRPHVPVLILKGK